MIEFTTTTNYGVKYTYTADMVAWDYANTAIQFDDNVDTLEELHDKVIKDESFLSQWWVYYIKYDIRLLQSQAMSEIVDKGAYDGFILSCMFSYGMVW